MTAQLIIECGVAETRAALIENERLKKFWFGPARGDEETDTAPRLGRRYVGRISSINPSLNAAFVDIGDGPDAFLSLGKAAGRHFTEGALISVTVKSPPRQGKGAVVKALPDVDIGAHAPGRLPPFLDAALEVVNAIGVVAHRIIIDEGQAAAILKASAITADIVHEQPTCGLFETYGAQSALETAFDRRISLRGGGEMIIDEAQALTAIDVDSASLMAPSPARLREKIATAAAYEAAHQISLRNIGGHIVIDFPSLEGEGARARFNTHLKKAMASIEGAGGFGFSKSGLFCFTAPHHAQSLLERFTQSSPDEPLSGRSFTMDFQAKSAIRNLENNLRADPRATLNLQLGVKLYDYVSAKETWRDRLMERYGGRFQIVSNNRIEERSFELAQ